MSDETSTASGVTPGADPSPVTGTAPSGAMPEKATLSAEELTKRLADLERSLSNAKEENTRHSKRLTAYEKQEQERAAQAQAVKDAELSELERVSKEHQKAQQQIQQYKQQLILEKVINAAQKKGIIDPELAAMAIEKSLELGEDGLPTNLDKVLDDLIKNKPYLVPAPPAEPATTAAQTATPNQSAPTLPPFAGRSSIPSAGTLPTGKPFTLRDYDWKK